jgi:hypothetical protein
MSECIRVDVKGTHLKGHKIPSAKDGTVVERLPVVERNLEEMVHTGEKRAL